MSVRHQDDWRARQRALADFATHALRNRDFDRLLQEACSHVTAALGVPIAKVAVLDEPAERLVLRATQGIPESVAEPNKTALPGGTNSAMAYAMLVGAPVISDIEKETRFEPSEMVRESGIKISANVVIWVNGRPYGSLEADSREPWQPTEADIDFLQTYATVVSAAIERHLLTRQVEALAQERQILLNEIFHRIKNLLTNVLSIARRTARHSGTLEEFQQAFEGRLGALSRAHDLLLAAPQQPARLRELVTLEFNAMGLREGRRFSIEGPDLLC